MKRTEVQPKAFQSKTVFEHRNTIIFQNNASCNRGQNSLGQMSFALKEAFPARKLLSSTANTPSPHYNVGCLKRTYLSTHLDIFISVQDCNGEWGGGCQLEISSKMRSVSRVLSSIVDII